MCPMRRKSITAPNYGARSCALMVPNVPGRLRGSSLNNLTGALGTLGGSFEERSRAREEGGVFFFYCVRIRRSVFFFFFGARGVPPREL